MKSGDISKKYIKDIDIYTDNMYNRRVKVKTYFYERYKNED